MTTSPIIKIHPQDSVGIARINLPAGMSLEAGCVTTEDIPAGHKVALKDHITGEKILRYGQIIGFATRDIAAGQHIHLHNLGLGDYGRDYAYCRDAKETNFLLDAPTFLGYRREDGRVGTRNYIGIITSVNCSAHVATSIARTFEKHVLLDADPLEAFPNVNGVIALTHKTGCGMGGGEPLDVLRRTIAGYVDHPNFSHVIVLGLGCEVNQTAGHLDFISNSAKVRFMNIQALGGTRQSIEQGVDVVKELLKESNRSVREPVSVSELSVALVCGGSDGYSGISANPALGAASDLLVQYGGTVILSETPETFGAEHLLTRRAISRQVGEKLVDRMQWWERYGNDQGVTLNANPSPGNKRGGITTILEKSLGALTKGGTTNLQEVVLYGERPSCKGLVFMDAPGYDPVQVTGQIAGGATVVAFTTGRGSVFGSKPSPTIKLASNSTLYQHMPEDMDIDCGGILEGAETINECGRRIFEMFVRVASGEKSKSEEQDFGDLEFAPWSLGPVI